MKNLFQAAVLAVQLLAKLIGTAFENFGFWLRGGVGGLVGQLKNLKVEAV